MDIKKYIASGVLEAYAAGELSEAEMKEVDTYAKQFPEIQQELEEIFDGLQRFAKSQGARPSESVLTGALAQINEDEKDGFLELVDGSEEDRMGNRFVKTFAIAASILFLISLGFNFFFMNKLGEKEEELASLLQQSNNLQASINQANQELAYADLRIAHFLSEDNIHVRMDGLNISPKSYANVFWNKKTNAVFISVDQLPEPPHGHQYQLWAIKPGQAPIDAGIFDHSKLVQELKVIKGDVQAFAVTLEKEGGSPIATVDKTYVKGFLKKS
ncbi:anti-sigma factor [Roseivirga pacifica]|uniref:anti-sigma factor n=1 Tax=Roseivirga pacifica TaxID=1267423 RepID=UPI003BABF870